MRNHLFVKMCPLTHLLAQCTGGRYHGVMNSVEKYIVWRADSMRIRPHGLVTVLVLTMWACAGLMIWTCSCCALMGMTCPGLCTSSPSVLPTPSSHTSVPMYVVSVQPPLLHASPVVQVPTPPPKALSVSA